MPTLDWIGKQSVLNHHRSVPFHLLENLSEYSSGAVGNGNLVLEGDNLVALKALLPYYSGKVKCIFIDPPYNTGFQGWIYNDAVKGPEIEKWLGKVVGTTELGDLSRHDKWLCMMYPRLQLLRDFLTEDGAIFITIDDTEIGHLRLLCDEIFGPQNFISNVIWQKKYSRQNDATWFSTSHDHVLVYARNKDLWRPNTVARTEKQKKNYSNPDNDSRGIWQSVVYTCNKSKEERPNLYYSIPYPKGHPKYGEEVFPSTTRVWAYDREGHEKNVLEDRVWWGPNNDFDKPRKKSFLAESKKGLVPASIWLRDEVGDNQAAKREAMIFNPEAPFPTPKPVSLIKYILGLATDKDSIILDSFGGSGTTAHAVMALNKEDGGNRKFIVIEMEETIAKNTIAKRLKMIMEGYTFEDSIETDTENDDIDEEIDTEIQAQRPRKKKKKDSGIVNVEGLGGGFRYCKLGDPLFDSSGMIRGVVSHKELAHHIFFTETGEPLAEDTEVNGYHIGSAKDKAVFLLYNYDSVSNNVFTPEILKCMPNFSGMRVVYGDRCVISAARLKQENIVFKQIPYEIKVG